jgi:hypothetical protein
LPNHIIEFNHNIFVRIFRILGGICLLLILSKKVFDFNPYIIYVVIFINLIFLIYQFVLLIYRIRNIYKILKSKDLEIRNSPLNNFATVFTKGLLCIKGVCEGGIFTGTILGTGIAFDWALESANKEKVFAPLVGSFIKKLSGIDSLNEEQRKQLEQLNFIKKTTDEKLNYIRKLNNIVKSNQEIEDIIQSIECQKDIFSEKDKSSLINAFKKEKESLISESLEVKKSLNMNDLVESFKKK